MQLRIKSLRSQRGDTIMEVLIAVAVLSFVLTSAFTLSNRSSQATRQAQERGEGSTQSETQMELLKTYLKTSPDLSGLPAAGRFCMKADATPTPPLTGPIPADAQADDFSVINSAINSNPALYGACRAGNFYSTYIERHGNTFTVHTRWDKVNGDGVEESVVVHRIYPDLAAEGQEAETINLGCTIHESYNTTGGGCTPCPYGTLSLGGYSRDCTPIPGHIYVSVEKIPPTDGGAAGSFTPPCTNGGIAASGIPLTLTRPGESLTGISSADFIITGDGFGKTYNATIKTLPTGFAVCGSSSQSVAAKPIEVPPNNTKSITFKIYPVCTMKTFDDWKLEDDPDTYYADHIGWGPTYYSQGERRSDLDGYYASSNGTSTSFDPNGSNVFNVGGSTVFLIYLKASGIYANTNWYNIWNAYPHNDKIYGPKYYHGQKWVNHPYQKSVCPS